MKVSNEITAEDPKDNGKAPFFKVVSTAEGKRYDVNIPSVGAFRLTTTELVIAVFVLMKILKI